MVRHWSLTNYFAIKTQNTSQRYHFSSPHAIKNSSGQMRQISRRMEMIHPTIGWRRDEHGTHKHAHGSWILWSASRVRSKTKHSLFCIVMVALHYSMLHRFEIFFCPFTTLLIGNKINNLLTLSVRSLQGNLRLRLDALTSLSLSQYFKASV